MSISNLIFYCKIPIGNTNRVANIYFNKNKDEYLVDTVEPCELNEYFSICKSVAFVMTEEGVITNPVFYIDENKLIIKQKT